MNVDAGSVQAENEPNQQTQLMNCHGSYASEHFPHVVIWFSADSGLCYHALWVVAA